MLKRLSASAPFLAAACLLASCAATRAADPSDDPRDGRVYIISNLHSGKRLAIEDGGQQNGDKIVQDDSTKTHVTWRLEKVGDGYFHVVNTSSGLVLDVPHDHAEKAGVRIQQWEAKDDGQHSNQYWEFVKIGEHYAIRCKKSSMVLDVDNASKEDGAPILQYPLKDERKSNQLWILTEVRK